MNKKVKELAEFHHISYTTMQAIYDDIILECNGVSEQKINVMMEYHTWLEERLLHSDRMLEQAMEMVRKLMGKLK